MYQALFIFILLSFCSSDLMAQGLTLQNISGKQVNIPLGREITIFSQEKGGTELIESKGRIVEVSEEYIEMNIQFLKKSMECDQPYGQIQTLEYNEYLPKRNYNVKIPTIDRIVVSKKSDALESMGVSLLVLGSIASIIVAPIWGLTDSSEKSFIKSTPGMISLIGTGAIITGTTITLIGNRKKTFHLSPSKNNNSDTAVWKIKP
jgi:hypothetical protein